MKIDKTILKAFFRYLGAFLVLGYFNIARAFDYVLLEPISALENVNSFSTYISSMFSLAIQLSIGLATFMIAWGGFEYIMSATPFGKGNGKQKVMDALIGLAIVLGSVLLLEFVDPNLVNMDFSLSIE